MFVFMYYVGCLYCAQIREVAGLVGYSSFFGGVCFRCRVSVCIKLPFLSLWEELKQTKVSSCSPY